MSRMLTNHKCLTVATVLTVLALAWTFSHGTAPAQAQASPYVRAFNFGPVAVGAEQSFVVSYSNAFGTRPFSVRARFYDANTGTLLRSQEELVGPGEGAILTPVPPCPQPPCQQAMSNLTTLAPGTMFVVGVVELADPRPTPLVSLQIIGPGGLVALADPRPTP